MLNPIEMCLKFFSKAVPTPDYKNRRVQLGVHFEEVHEMLMCLKGVDEHSSMMLDNMREAMQEFSHELKTGKTNVIMSQQKKIDFLDSICDQMVTLIGSAHMHEMDIDGGFTEVNKSNLSKFDEEGNPIFDDNGKIIKGPSYFKPDLTNFVI